MNIEKKTEVVGITLKIKGKEIELTIDEAKELKEELTKLFAEPVTYKEYVPYYPYIPYEPYKPYEPWVQPWWGITPPSSLPGIYCSPNTTSGRTITVGDLPSTSLTAKEVFISQFCNTLPTDATCGSLGFQVINAGGGCDVIS